MRPGHRSLLRTVLRYLKSVPVGLWIYFGVLAALLYGFAEFADEVVEQDRILFDEAVLTALEGVQGPAMDRVAQVLDVVGGVWVLAPASLLGVLLLWRVRHRSAVFFALSVGGAVGLNVLAKGVFARARPDLFEALVPASGYAFPSGHAMGSVAFVASWYFVARFHRSRWRWVVLALGVPFALAVGLSRSYLQVHYPSDVAAALLLSAAWVLGVNAWYARARRRTR